jgi:hypothetical protein
MFFFVIFLGHLDLCVHPIILSCKPVQTAPLNIILKLNYKTEQYGLCVNLDRLEKSCKKKTTFLKF